MRTIRLTEHKAATETLSAEELSELSSLPLGLVEISPYGVKDRFTIKARSRVGTIALPSIRVLIRPKVASRNVFFLLAYTNRIRWRPEDFPYEEDDLFEVIALWFDRECARAARFGLVRDYIDREEALSTLRGRLAVERQIARRAGRRIPVECRYQDYSEDTALNRVVKAAHDALLRIPSLNREVAIRLRHRTRHVLGDVARTDYDSASLPAVTITRLNRQWESAFRLVWRA
jgi:5-methylcytosine-specific restriction endonuclease McrBC regulatory subunit McrC